MVLHTDIYLLTYTSFESTKSANIVKVDEGRQRSKEVGCETSPPFQTLLSLIP